MIAKFYHHMLCVLFLCIAATGHAKVYDCFMFFNEIELLKMRLEELDSVVDYFVLVEHAETEKGADKPFYFQENRELFQKYRSKILHLMVDARHPEMSAWQRENFQRGSIGRCLAHCKPSDIIMISDLDEIPRSEIVQKLKNELLTEKALPSEKHKRKHKKSKSHKKEEPPESFALQMSIYFYHLNRQTPTGETWGGGPWIGTCATTYKTFAKVGAQHLRDQRLSFFRLYNAGWHFTWMGGKEQIRKKMDSVADNYPSGASVSDAEIERMINGHPIVPIDSNFPKYVQKNIAYLKSIGYIAD